MIEMFICYTLCWLLSFDWIEWHDLCRKNDRIVWTLDQQPFTLICSIAKSSPLFQQHHFTPLKSSLDVFCSKLCDKWELSSKQPESCKMLRRLSTILNALNFETIWSISSLTKLVNYVSLPFSKNIHFAVAALRFISSFAAKVFV